MNLILLGLAVIAVSAIYAVWQLNKAKKQIDRLLQDNAKLAQQKAVAETVVKNHQVRKNNEENNRTSDRTAVLDRLHADGDLRDE